MGNSQLSGAESPDSRLKNHHRITQQPTSNLVSFFMLAPAISAIRLGHL